MFEPSRDEARLFLVETWRKHRTRELLSPLEAIAADIISGHPEFHPVLEAPADAPQQDYPPEDGALNPYLHLHLHLAVAEQLSIDQPPGIRSIYERLMTRLDSPMDAQHAIIDCLAETIWRAQRDRTPPDGEAYVACLERKARL